METPMTALEIEERAYNLGLRVGLTSTDYELVSMMESAGEIVAVEPKPSGVVQYIGA